MAEFEAAHHHSQEGSDDVWKNVISSLSMICNMIIDELRSRPECDSKIEEKHHIIKAY